MTTKRITIPVEVIVDANFQHPEGEFVFREVRAGDKFIAMPPSGSAALCEAPLGYLSKGDYRIVFESPIAKYKWPEFIPAGWWIARDMDGRWFMYSTKPLLCRTKFGFGGVIEGSMTALEHLVWSAPVVKDWTASLFQKPVQQ